MHTAHAAAAHPVPQPALARQAIIDSKLGVFGYEIVQRGAQDDRARDAQAMLHLLSLAGSTAAADQRPMFLPCTLETLSRGDLELADAGKVVLQVALPAAIDASGIASASGALQTARKKGFRLAFAHQVLAPAWRSWLLHANFIKFDMAQVPSGVMQDIVRESRRKPGLQLVACGIDTPIAFQTAKAANVALYQGSWFARPMAVHSQTVRPAQAIVLQLISLLRNERPTNEIEALLKRDAALSLSLLRMVNSPAFGLSREVTSFGQAVMLLGMKKLFRWAALLVATPRDGVAPAIGHTAVVRGRMMELLATDVLAPEECDHAFVVGIFSLLEQMTGVPLARALEGIALPESVLAALMHNTGPLAPYLAVAKACEGTDDAEFFAAAHALSLPDTQVNAAHLQALAWAGELLPRA